MKKFNLTNVYEWFWYSFLGLWASLVFAISFTKFPVAGGYLEPNYRINK
tara:strand:+ start:849 stop:995 length:147 start_codon:yes stop_codon:yes gene_type:complete